MSRTCGDNRYADIHMHVAAMGFDLSCVQSAQRAGQSPPTAGIYRITHQPTGLWYAGASVTPNTRLQAHRRALRAAIADPDAAKGWPMRLMAHLTQPDNPESLIRHWWLNYIHYPRSLYTRPQAPPRVVLPLEADLRFEVVQSCPESITALREAEQQHQGPLNHPAGRPYGDHARIKTRQWRAA